MPRMTVLRLLASGGNENGGFSLSEDTLGGGMIARSWQAADDMGDRKLPCLRAASRLRPLHPADVSHPEREAREGEGLSTRLGFLLSSSYVLMMAAAFGVLAAAAAWSDQNLQMILKLPWAIGAVAGLFVMLASSMFGLFELQLPTAWVSRMAGVQAGTRGSIGGAAGMTSSRRSSGDRA